MPKTVTPHDLRVALEQEPKTQVADVRESPEIAADGFIEGAVPAPLSTDARAAHLFDAQKPVYLLCRSGARAEKAAALLKKRGFADLRVVAGGMEAWQDAGYEVLRRGAGVWSLERQVRFTVAVVLLVSSVLGRLWHPGFYALVPLVGAGLLYSAVSNTCGMAAVLAKLPWNSRA